MIVDWRNRDGRRFVTSVRSQGPAPNCWAFAMTALYESMVRIEHNLWVRLSEGDVARGAGKQPWDWGNAGEAHIFVERYGLADPDCFPWSWHAAAYTAKPHGASLTAMPMSPTPDRPGRTMRIRPGTYVELGTTQQKRDWLDLVGPMVVQVGVTQDFGVYAGGIYTPTPGSPGIGDHLMLVVGFDDDQACWIVKNSWGPWWGEGGYARIAYASGMLEARAFVGVRGTNPSPWSKRRQRTGALVQGGNGGHNNNFELFVLVGGQIQHWYRENTGGAQTWHGLGPIQSPDPWRPLPADTVDTPAVVQSSFNRNYELVYRCGEGTLHHAYFDQAAGWWFDASVVRDAQGVVPAGVVGIPGLVQSDRGAPGDLEVLAVTQRGVAEHWTKHNGPPWTRLPGEWHLRERFGGDLTASGPALVQSRLGRTGFPERGTGELHWVGVGADGRMQHWSRAPGATWQLLSVFGAGVTTGPALIEGTYGAGDESGTGNFELCVAVGEHVQHWWRHNAGAGPWVLGAEFGDAVRRVVGLLQGTYGTNLELVVERTDGTVQHLWRDGGGWHTGPVVV